MKIYLIFFFFLFFIARSSAQNTAMSLDDCILYAINNNYEVLNELQKNNIADSEKEQAFWAHFPTINASTYITTTFNKSTKEENLYGQNAIFGNEYALEAKMPLYSGGKLAYNNKVAKKNKEKIQLNLQSIQDAVAERTMMAYINVLYNSQVLKFRRKMVESYIYQKERLERMYHLGGSSISDLSQIKAALSKEELEVSKTILAYDKSIIDLKRIMNFPIRDTLMIENDIPIETPYASAKISKEDMNFYLLRDPNTQKLQKEAEINEEGLKMARQYYFPTVYINGTIGSSFFSPLKNRAQEIMLWNNQLYKNLSYKLGITIVFPIFNGFQAKHEILKAKSNLAISNQNFHELKNQLEAMILRVEKELYALENQRKLSWENLKLTRIANASLTRKYQEGAISLIEMQSSNNQLLESELEYLQFHLNYQIKIRVLNHYKGVSYIKQQ